MITKTELIKNNWQATTRPNVYIKTSNNSNTYLNFDIATQHTELYMQSGLASIIEVLNIDTIQELNTVAKAFRLE